MKGAYGAWINTDGFTIGEKKETYAGLRIFEIAKQAGICHYVWSSLDYAFKVHPGRIISHRDFDCLIDAFHFSLVDMTLSIGVITTTVRSVASFLAQSLALDKLVKVKHA